MRLNLRITKPVKRTLTVDIPTIEGNDPCLKDLYSKAVQAFELQISDAVNFSLNNKDLLSGDHVPLPVFGIVNGDLIYVHLPADYVFEGTSSAAGGNDSTSSRKNTPDQVTKIDNATNASTSEQCKMETECSYNKSADVSPESSLQHVNDGSLNNVNDVLSEIDAEDYAKVTEVEELSAKEVNHYLQQAMLIRDTAGDHIPHSLQTALGSTQPHTEHHYVFVVIHILVLETGFMLQHPSDGLSPEILKLGTLRLGYRYRDEQTSFNLVAVPIGNTLVIHAISQGEETVNYSVTVKPRNYVTVSAQGFKFQKLSQLSREVKDRLTYPMLQSITKDEQCSVPSLTNLLYEIKTVILKYLDARSLLQLSETCVSYSDLCKRPVYWYRLFIKDFGKSKAVSNDSRENWIERYKTQYKMRKRVCEQLRRARCIAPPCVGRIYPPLPRLPPWVPPFMVGGDYDRLPGAPLFPGMGSDIFPRAPRYDPIGPLPDDLVDPGRGGLYPMIPDFRHHMTNPLIAPNMGPRRSVPGRGRGPSGHGFGPHRTMFF